jgi:hypothetical protein
MPHGREGYGEARATVSCHVERPLDDGVWRLFARLQRQRPGGFAIAALMRPPDERAGEGWQPWLERAREAAAQGPLGQHTHWTAPEHARPTGGEPAERVVSEGARLRDEGVPATLFCGGAWYIDGEVAEAVAELGYADCTATAFQPGYLPDGASRAQLAEPARVRLPSGRVLAELPSTHSLGVAARAAMRALPRYLHVYFHDTDLLDQRRRWALLLALKLLGRRATPVRLDELAAEEAPELPWSDVARG